MAIFPGSAIPSAVSDYEIDNSLRFDDGDSPKLSRTNVGGSASTKFTYSAWVKRGEFSDAGTNRIFSAVGSPYDTYFRFTGSDQLEISDDQTTGYLTTKRVFRDPSAWYHIVITYDSEQVTASDRLNLYVNGVIETEFDPNNYPTQDQVDYATAPGTVIDISSNGSAQYWDGYFAEVCFIDGTAYDADSFGKLDSGTNQWKPIDASGLTFGTNGFYQKYSSTELADSFADSANHSIHTMTAHGDANTYTAEKKFGTASLQCVGTDAADFLSTPNSDDFMFGTGDFTVEYWVYTTNSGVYQYLMGQIRADGTDEFFMRLNTDSKVLFMLKGESSAKQCVGTTALSVSTWYHIAGVRDGDNLRLYIDGVLEDTEAFTSQSQERPTVVFEVGATPYNSDAGGSGFSGYIDEFRISNTCRYPSGTTFTPATTAFTADKYTKLLLHMDGVDGATSFPDSSWTGAPRHTITANGDVTNTNAVRKVGDSSIAFDGTGDYLSIPDSSDWDLYETTATTFTYEAWIKFDSAPSGSTDVPAFIAQWADDDNKWQLGMGSGAIQFYLRSGGSTIFSDTGGTITDTDWHHVAWVKNGTSLRTFVDGVLELDTTKSDTANFTGGLYIGTIHGVAQFFDGHMTEIRVSDVARYTATFTTFGQDGGTISNPTAFTADANTKLLIHSNWDGGLGADSSGNLNTFAATNLVATDQMLDTPTNNFPTWNPLCYSPWTSFSEGNLKNTGTSGSYQGNTIASISPPSTGKWYFEFMCTVQGSGYPFTGTVDATVYEKVGTWKDAAGDPGDMTGSNGGWRINTDGAYETDGGGDTAGGQVPGTSDILQYALDHDNGALYYGINNTWYTPSASGGDPTSGASRTGAVMTWTAGTRSFIPAVGSYNTSIIIMNAGQDSSFAGTKTSGSAAAQDGNEKGDFYYAPPSGYLALCTDNLSDPEIALPEENFLPKIYTGVSGALTVTTGIEAGMIWFKGRNNVEPFTLFDTLRGALNSINPAVTAAEASIANSLTAFSSTGFSVGSADQTGGGYNYSSWNWKAGGTPTATNSAGAGAVPTAGSVKIDGSNLGSALGGTIAATKLSANTAAGFSIVTYTGTGSDATVAHGLSEAPDLIWVMRLTDAGYFKIISTTEAGLSFAKYFRTDTNDPVGTGNYWQDTDPSASVFSIEGADNSTNGSSKNFVGYCWHSVEGFSKIGSYTGNNDANGTFVYTGMSPSWVLIKATAATQNWTQFDSARQTYNLNNKYFTTNGSAAETTGFGIDFLSNGFKLRVTDVEINANSGNFLYMAFAENPFKLANAR